jgi:high-affinity Fe2+/Pb2+ permease
MEQQAQPAALTPEQMITKAHKLAEESILLRKQYGFVYDTASAKAMLAVTVGNAKAAYTEAFEAHTKADQMRDEATELFALARGSV